MGLLAAVALAFTSTAMAEDAPEARTPGPAGLVGEVGDRGGGAAAAPGAAVEVPLGEVRGGPVEAVDGGRIVEVDDGKRLRIEGPGYVADFDGGEVRVACDPADDQAPRARFTYRLARVAAGGAAVFDAASGPLATSAHRLDPRAIGYRRSPGLAERYEPRAAGVEQLFVIDEPLPAGADLVIEGVYAIEVDAAPDSAHTGVKPVALRVPGRGVIFVTPGADGASAARELLCYGEPTLIDAAGREVPGELILDADAATLTLAFSASQVAGLAYPLTVDPLIGSNFTIRATTNQERGAAIAFNSVRSEYLVVWEVQIGTGTDYDVWGQRVNASGTLLGSAFAIRNQVGVAERNPDVAYSPSTDRYVLAMEFGTGGDVIQATITWSGGYVGAWYLDNRAPPIGFSRDPKVVHQTGDTFCFVWSDSDASNPQNQWLLCERRDSNANFVGNPINDDWIIQSTTGATAFRRPSVVYNATEDDFYFAWEHTDGSARSVAITGDLLFYIGPWPNITLSSAGREPAVTWNSTANEYVVAWPDNVIFGPDYDLYTQRVYATGALVGNKRGGIHANDITSLDEREPAIRYSLGAGRPKCPGIRTVKVPRRRSAGRPRRCADGFSDDPVRWVRGGVSLRLRDGRGLHGASRHAAFDLDRRQRMRARGGRPAQCRSADARSGRWTRSRGSRGPAVRGKSDVGG